MKKWLFLILALAPATAFAYIVSGIDDQDLILPKDVSEKLDWAIITYYQAPSVEKVNIVLDTMNNTELLQKKTAWSPLVGFLTVVFQNNKNHVFAWMTRNDYNSFAQQVFVNALLHAKLKESALVFAQAHHWNAEDMADLRGVQDSLDLKHFEVLLPSHIDTLWGAYFASGDPVYANEIIDVVFRDYVGYNEQIQPPIMDYDVVGENKKLAERTLNMYARNLPEVRAILQARLDNEKDAKKQQELKSIIPAAK